MEQGQNIFSNNFRRIIVFYFFSYNDAQREAKRSGWLRNYDLHILRNDNCELK